MAEALALCLYTKASLAAARTAVALYPFPLSPFPFLSFLLPAFTYLPNPFFPASMYTQPAA
jgi:hypothetical protein